MLLFVAHYHVKKNDHIVPSIVWKQQGEKERHLSSEPETIPVMAHCARDEHGEAASPSSSRLPGTDNVLVKYSSNYYR